MVCGVLEWLIMLQGVWETVGDGGMKLSPEIYLAGLFRGGF